MTALGAFRHGRRVSGGRSATASGGFDLQCMLEGAIKAHIERKGCKFHPATVAMVKKSLAYRVTKLCIWWLGKVLERFESCKQVGGKTSLWVDKEASSTRLLS